SNGLKDKIEQSAAIPSPYVLTIGEVTTEHDGSTGTIHVHTRQQMVEAVLPAAISFSPAVKFTTELADDGFTIRSDNFDQDKSYTLTIAKGLRGRIGGGLPGVFFANITLRKQAPPHR